MARDNIGPLRQSVSLVETARSFGVELFKDGREFKACCPFHQDDTPSCTFFRGKDGVGRYHCFGCGAAGDVVDFVMGIKGVDHREAIAILAGQAPPPNVQPRQSVERSIYDDYVPIDPPRELAVKQIVAIFNPKRAGQDHEWGRFAPSAVHPYRRADGSLIGYVLRRNMKGGGKETPMVMYVQGPEGMKGWARCPFPKPRPLYGLHELRPGQVIVVEGEKCRDALAAIRPNVVSWPGGVQGVRHADWSPLAGRSVVIVPDADEPGKAAATTVAGLLHPLGSQIKIAWPKGKR